MTGTRRIPSAAGFRFRVVASVAAAGHLLLSWTRSSGAASESCFSTKASAPRASGDDHLDRVEFHDRCELDLVSTIFAYQVAVSVTIEIIEIACDDVGQDLHGEDRQVLGPRIPRVVVAWPRPRYLGASRFGECR
jgi:hypothetical protein